MTSPQRSNWANLLVLVGLSAVGYLVYFVSHAQQPDQTTTAFTPPCSHVISTELASLKQLKAKLNKILSNQKQLSKADMVEQLQRVLSDGGEVEKKAAKSNETGICDETWMSAKFGHPLYYKGFVDECKTNKGNDVQMILFAVDKQQDMTAGITKSAMRIYPNINITTVTSLQELSKKIASIDRKFTYFARDLFEFTPEINLERMQREILLQKTPIIGGAVRNAFDSIWNSNCYQSTLLNFTLQYKSGYVTSRRECARCDYLEGPFLVETALLKNIGFTKFDNFDAAFHDFFLRAAVAVHGTAVRRFVDDTIALSCFDVMSDIVTRTDRYGKKFAWKDWIPFLEQWRVERIRLPNDLMRQNCSQHQLECKMVPKKGFAQNPCCLQRLSDGVKRVDGYLKKHNSMMLTTDGTSIGIYKFNSLLPYEIDADVWLPKSNYSALQDKKLLNDAMAGYAIDGGWMNTIAKPFTIEIWILNPVMKALNTSFPRGLTRVPFDGYLLNTDYNIGKVVRNRYGRETLRHSEHWRNLGWENSWNNYTNTFSECSDPTRHDCLRHLPLDGNIPYNDESYFYLVRGWLV